MRHAVLVLCLAALASPAAAESAGERLKRAYPEAILRVEGNELVFKDGRKVPISDGRANKTAEQLLEEPDLDDMFAYAYPKGAIQTPPARDQDPGRIRNLPFFSHMYGDCKRGEVEARLVTVPWLPKHGGGSVRMTRVNGVAEKIAAVSAEFESMPSDQLRPLLPFLVPLAGGYNCRPIAGTKTISGHGFGFAIDISTSRGDYWRWGRLLGNRQVPYRNRIPYAVAEVFERHGFIWGAKWYHYDTMHFEYRPELLQD